MIYMTISTGIGGGFILNGKLYRGAGLLSSEVGQGRTATAGRGVAWRCWRLARRLRCRRWHGCLMMDSSCN